MGESLTVSQILDLRPGSRVKITYLEFPTWRPTHATVMKLYIKFPGSEPPIRRQMMTVRLDEHPFPEQLWWEPMRDFGFEIEDASIVMERL